MNETGQKSNKKARLPVLIACMAAVMYFISDPTLEWAYPMYATYRIQTLVRLSRRAVLILVYSAFAGYCFHLRKKQMKINFGILPFYLLLYGGYLLASILNSGTEQLVHWLDVVLMSSVPLLLFCLMLSSEESARQFVRVLSVCYLVLLVLNILFYYFPQLYLGEAKDWREDFFLGSKNRAGWPVMMGLFFGTLDYRLGNSKWELGIFLLFSVVNVFLIHSAMTLIGAFVFLLFTLFPVFRKIPEKTDLALIVVLILLLFCMLMWFLMPVTTSKPVVALLEMMGKDPGLSERDVLWGTAREIIAEKPFFGYGLQESSAFIPHTNPYGTTYHHGHNEMVQTLYEGGVLTLGLAVLMLFYTAAKIRRSENKTVAAVCKTGLFSFLVMLQSDFIPYFSWYMVAFLANCAILLAEDSGGSSFSGLLADRFREREFKTER